MFSNLIESSSHRREFRRRGSFFLFTTVSYALLFVIAGVISIYAYDARMEDQNLEMAMIMPLVDPIFDNERDITPEAHKPAHGERPQSDFIRRNPTGSVNQPNLTPDHISSAPNTNPPIPPGGRFSVGPIDRDPVHPGTPGSTTGNGRPNSTGPAVVISDPPPAAQPMPKPAPKVVRKKVLNGDALFLPKPPYPPLAKQIGARGSVNVQVLIDEKGNVISATPVSGHPLLLHAAKAAALQARFSPTMLGDQPVKVSGVITYNFVLQ